MADDVLTAAATLDTTQFEAGARRGAQAVADLQTRIDQVNSRFASGAGNVDGWTKSVSSLQTQLTKAQGTLEQFVTSTGRTQQAALAAVAGNNALERAVRSSVDAQREAGNVASVLGVNLSILGRRTTAVFDELAAGRYRQFYGTLTSVLGIVVQTNAALAGGIITIGAAAVAVGILGYRWYEATEALRQYEGQQLIMGHLGSDTATQMSQGVDRLTSFFGFSQSEAQKVQLTLGTLTGSARAFRSQLQDLGAEQASLAHGDVVKTTKEWVDAFNGGSESAAKFAEKLMDIQGPERTHLDLVAKSGSDMDTFNAIVAIAQKQWAGQAEQIAKNTQELKQYMDQAAAFGMAGLTPPASAIPNIGNLHPQPNAQPEDYRRNEELAAINKIVPALQKKQELEAQIRNLESLPLPAGSQEEQGRIEALIVLRRELARTHTVSEQQEHNATLQRLQSDLAAAKNDADQQVAIQQKIASEQARYYGANSNEARSTEQEVSRATQSAAQQRLRIHINELQQEEAAARDNLKKQIDIQQQIVQAYRTAGAQKTAEGLAAQTQLQTLEAREADKEVQITITKFRQQQAAAKGNYTAILQIEDEILAALAQRYGKDSEQYQREQQLQVEMTRAAKEQELQIAIQQANTAAKTASQATTLAMEKIRASVNSSHGLSFADLFGGRDQTAEVQAQLQTIEQAYQKAYAQIDAAKKQATDPKSLQVLLDRDKTLHQQYTNTVERVHIMAAQKTKQAWDQTLNGMFSGFNSAFRGILNGTETFQQAELQLMNSLGDALLEIPLKIAEQWIISEIEKWLGIGAADQAGAATQTGLNVATIQSEAAVAAAGAYAATAGIPYVGPILAPGAAATALGDVESFEGMAAIGSFDVGAWSIPRDMLGIIHRGEQIVPQSYADGLRSATGSSGQPQQQAQPEVHIHVHANDTVTGAQFLKSQAPQIARDLARQIRMGNRDLTQSLRPR